MPYRPIGPDGIHSILAGTGRYVPEPVLTNADLMRMVDTNDEWIVTRTGIRRRHVLPAELAVSDMCFGAAQQALTASGIAPEAIEAVLVATVTPDYAFPSTACLIQDRLGIPPGPCFDLEAGCAGFIYALSTADAMIRSGQVETALVCGAETLTRITDYTDRGTCILFGDGAGAVVLQSRTDRDGILSTYLGANGKYADLIMQSAGGSRMPLTPEALATRQNTIKMNGNEVFKRGVLCMAEACEIAQQRAGISSDQVDLFIPHQANIRIIESLAQRMKIPPERVLINIEEYGNTSAASIPIALDEAIRNGRLQPGMIVQMVAVGAGFTYGSVIVRA